MSGKMPFEVADLSLVVLSDLLDATNTSAASCSNRVAANRRQSVAFIFLFRNPIGRLSRRLIGLLLCDDSNEGEKLVSAFDEILRFAPDMVTEGVGDGSSMFSILIVDGDIVDCETTTGWAILPFPVYVRTGLAVSLFVTT